MRHPWYDLIFLYLILTLYLDSISKTGLGSSAALVTSLTAALLAFFGLIEPSSVLSSESSSLVHNLSQLVHCKAQGKVGSGFDVATAIYGE